MKPETRAGQLALKHCTAANIPFTMLTNVFSWDDRDGLKRLQAELKHYDGAIDGLFWRNSVNAFVQQFQKGYIITDGTLAQAPGIPVINYLSPVVHRFKARRKITPVGIVVHEPVARGVSRIVNILSRRHLGVHFIVSSEGTITQHADTHDRLGHAGRWNKHTLGLEVENIYYGHLARGEEKKRIISAKWAHKKRYVVPTKEALDSATDLIAYLCDVVETIPQRWLGLKANNTMRMGRLPRDLRDPKQPGIWAHTYFAHADGGYIVEYAKEKLEDA